MNLAPSADGRLAVDLSAGGLSVNGPEVADVEWRRATASDAALLAELAGRTSDTNIRPDEALAFLRSWHVEIADQGRAAIAVLPPASGHSRGYGAWWTRHGSAFDRFSEIGGRLVQLAASMPGLSILQISLPEDRDVDVEQLRALRFDRAYPLWTMVHDDNSWPDRQPELPVPLRFGRWSDVGSDEFQSAYEQAYRDQRPVEPHTAEAWERLTSGNSFATDLAALAVAPDGQVAGFVLSFHQNHGGIELGPIGTIPSWRGHGVSSALLASVLMRSREIRSGSLTLTVDGESPTNAQDLYLRHGFQVTHRLIAFHVRMPTLPG